MRNCEQHSAGTDSLHVGWSTDHVCFGQRQTAQFRRPPLADPPTVLQRCMCTKCIKGGMKTREPPLSFRPAAWRVASSITAACAQIFIARRWIRKRFYPSFFKNIRRPYLIYKNGYRFWVWVSRLDVSCIWFAPWKRNKNIPKLPPPARNRCYPLELFLCECLFRLMAGDPCKSYRWAFWVFATDRSQTK